MVDDLFVADKGESLQKVYGGDTLAALFIASVEERITERECKLYDEDLNSKVKLYSSVWNL